MFKFKYFTIHDQNSAMKVGTDGVLLGAWLTLPPKESAILDIGCGSGILSLIMAQRSGGGLYIDAIDIDEGAIKDSKKNFELSGWNSTLNPILGNFVSYSGNCGRIYDTIVSNPPFFTEDTLSPDFKRASARNTSSLNFETLFQGVAKISNPNTIFAMISPADNYSFVAQTALLNGFYLRRLTWVVTIEGTEPKRVLTEWERVQTQFSIDTLIISNRDGSYSADYKELTKDFYL
ncbi:MAG: methyltransferase [Bacteroidales bacterium]|nr:methyltransferase [Bacteroidales bacterium]